MAGTGKAHLRPHGEALLRVEDLVVEFKIGATGNVVNAVSGISLDVLAGETVGLVGESGCGKSTTGKAIMGVPSPTSGSVLLDAVDLTGLSHDEMRRIRPDLQMIFQDPISSLNPRRSIGDIVAEPLMIKREDQVGHGPVRGWLKRYASRFVAVAETVTKPLRVLLVLASVAFVLWVVSEAAEGRRFESELAWTEVPAQIVGFPVLVILVAMAVVVFAGCLVWLALAAMIPFEVVSGYLAPISPAVGLLGAASSAAVSWFMVYRTWNSLGGNFAWVVRGGVLTVATVSIMWLVASAIKPSRAGAAGVAASLASLAYLQVFYIAGLDAVTKLVVILASAALDYFIVKLVVKKLAMRRSDTQRRFDPLVREMLEVVGMNPDSTVGRKPHELSGGQAQRVSIARALIMNPKVLICDEPVSALDVSVQAQTLNLLQDMKQRYGLTLLFIAHDLAVVKNVSDRVAVMYLGKLCEVGAPDSLFANPAHPYTELLLSAIAHPDPLIDPSITEVPADLPSAVSPPSGCRFRTRCPRAEEHCGQREPQMRPTVVGQYVACHFPLVEMG